VLIEDGGVVVLGGLTQNTNTKQESRVPILGSIPIIGLAFKTRSNQVDKENLMIFIRPKIIRDQAQAAYETELKYNFMQDQQRLNERREIPPLLPGERPTRLPPLVQPPTPPGTQAAPISPEEKARAAEASRRADEASQRRGSPLPPAPSAAPAQPAPAPSPDQAAPANPPAAPTPPTSTPPQTSLTAPGRTTPGMAAPTSVARAVPSTPPAQDGGSR
jgi:general secretion pathway protein D